MHVKAYKVIQFVKRKEKKKCPQLISVSSRTLTEIDDVLKNGGEVPGSDDVVHHLKMQESFRLGEPACLDAQLR